MHTTLHRSEVDYPARLRALKPGPEWITVSGPLGSGPVIAIVGTRDPRDASVAFAKQLAGRIVTAGGIVVSGAATGIDTAAHRGALDAGGRTWAIAPSGPDAFVPTASKSLYEEIIATPGSAVLWPFPVKTRGRRAPFLKRNGVLAALCDTLVVVEAPIKSGARNAAWWMRKLKRRYWAVAGPPWSGYEGKFEGCFLELDLGAQRLTSIDDFLSVTGLLHGGPAPLPSRALSDVEIQVVEALSTTPKHADEVARAVGLDAPSVSTALLTLALEDVVVEGPGGFFRRVSP